MTDHLTKYGLVLGEGKKDAAVLKKITPTDSQNRLIYENYEGKNQLKSFLETTLKSPNYTNGRIRKILVTRDADENWESAWQSVREAIQSVFKVSVSAPGQWQEIERLSLNWDSDIFDEIKTLLVQTSEF